MAAKPPPRTNRRLFNSPEMDLIAYFPKGSRVYCYSYVFKVVPCSLLHVLYDFSMGGAMRRMDGVSPQLSDVHGFDVAHSLGASLEVRQPYHPPDEWLKHRKTS